MPKLTFGKHRGQTWTEVPTDYLQWMERQTEMDSDVVWHVQQELARRRSR